MSEMTDAVKATILRTFTARGVELAAERANTEVHPRPWRWTPGITLFPEGICPYCQATIRSNRIWKITDRTLHGQYRLVPAVEVGGMGKLEQEPPEHPHVTGTNVCVGTAASTISAMFLFINLSDNYWGRDEVKIKGWLLKVFNHICEQEGAVEISDCPTCGGVYTEGMTPPHDCMQTRCLCGCGCYPAYYNRVRYNFNCSCCCSRCTCTARIRQYREMQAQALGVSVAEVPDSPAVCSHHCRDCCREAGCTRRG